MTGVTIHDTRFRALLPEGAEVVTLFAGGAFCEGPVWFADLGCLLWSDIPNNRILRWTADGHVSVFREPSHFANGNTRDPWGRLVTCEHVTRRVTRTELDGSITVIADRHAGGRLNSPNDVVVKSDGSVWFTDPDYGLRQEMPGAAREQAKDNVFRVDTSGRISVVVDDFVKPNGLCFSPDESLLYIADSAVSDGPQFPSHIRRFRVHDDGTLSGGEVFMTTVGIPDGLRIDTKGNVWTSAGSGVNCYAPAGDFLGRIAFAHAVTNVAFGGPGRSRLFVTAGPGLYAIDTNAVGALRP
ncbi:MAG TPA: SMP-30/gluconolactonase/LRE family protein [Bauldia sp.]|nr:SMP-30/gluconolactonase/LRE family protein [Bauldia sp.]